MIYIFFAGGGLGSITNSNLALSFFPTSQRFDRSDLPKSNVNISRHMFDNFPPKKCNCSDFWMDKKIISKTLPGILLSLCSPFAATLFFLFSCEESDAIQPCRISTSAIQCKTWSVKNTAERFLVFFHLGKSGLFFAKWFMPWSSMTVKAISPVLPCPKLTAFAPQKESNFPSQLLFWKLCGCFQK